jgi:cell division protein FtsL
VKSRVEAVVQRVIATINWLLMLATLASAIALYAVKHDTRRLEVRVLAQERTLERAQNDVTVLTAERAHLARPARLEVLARAIGMSPITADQYLRLDAGMTADPEGGTALSSGSSSVIRR